MPYITQPERDEIDAGLKIPSTPGQLNYQLAQVVFDRSWKDTNFSLKEAVLEKARVYIKHNGLRYQTINDVVGAIICCETELVRRGVIQDSHDPLLKTLSSAAVEFYSDYAGPYEDAAIARNGDLNCF